MHKKNWLKILKGVFYSFIMIFIFACSEDKTEKNKQGLVTKDHKYQIWLEGLVEQSNKRLHDNKNDISERVKTFSEYEFEFVPEKNRLTNDWIGVESTYVLYAGKHMTLKMAKAAYKLSYLEHESYAIQQTCKFYIDKMSQNGFYKINRFKTLDGELIKEYKIDLSVCERYFSQ
ncbi:hypothetical protein [Marinicella gelatinilytica]|uniref:hypothetical protein n=1 Tax=Marinicella gelatinilytica TaxID=2996017 RepID=UPI002260CB5D|nr:hypothetical protein [Marinicella gelatinilytica]MCX7545316.1 hypothetical protein [Marinicella gelatinilytica]